MGRATEINEYICPVMMQIKTDIERIEGVKSSVGRGVYICA